MVNARSVLLVSGVALFTSTQAHADSFLGFTRENGAGFWRTERVAPVDRPTRVETRNVLGVFTARKRGGVFSGDTSFTCPGCGQRISLMRSAFGSFGAGHGFGCAG
jgi:hypothetical protein